MGAGRVQLARLLVLCMLQRVLLTGLRTSAAGRGRCGLAPAAVTAAMRRMTQVRLGRGVPACRNGLAVVVEHSCSCQKWVCSPAHLPARLPARSLSGFDPACWLSCTAEGQRPLWTVREVAGQRVVVRRARPNERTVPHGYWGSIDNVERELRSEASLTCAASTPDPLMHIPHLSMVAVAPLSHICLLFSPPNTRCPLLLLAPLLQEVDAAAWLPGPPAHTTGAAPQRGQHAIRSGGQPWRPGR